MSEETTTPQNVSFLTRAMLLADRRKKDDDNSNENPGFATDKKKFVAIAVAATVGTAAAIALSWKALSNMAPVEDETTDEEITPED